MATSLVSTGVQFPDSTIQTSAAGGSNYVLIQNITVSTASAYVDLTGLSDTYKFYKVLLSVPPTGSVYVSTLNIQFLDSSSNVFPTSGSYLPYAGYQSGGEFATSPYINKSQYSVGIPTIYNTDYAATDKNPFAIEAQIYKSPDGTNRPSHWASGVTYMMQSTYPYPGTFMGGWGSYNTPTTPYLRGIRLNNSSGQNFFVSGTSVQLWGWRIS